MANLSGYNFAYLDEQTKRMIRRAILKAVAIPAIRCRSAAEKCRCPTAGDGRHPDYRQRDRRGGRAEGHRPGADDTTNAVSIRTFFQRVTGVATTEKPKTRR